MTRYIKMKPLSFSQFEMVIIFLFTSLFCISSVTGLHCAKCVSIDCSTGVKDCDRLRAVAQWELSDLYYFGSLHLAPCPVAHDTDGWQQLQSQDKEPCPQDKPECAIGQILFTVRDLDEHGNITDTRYNRATVFGCGNSNRFKNQSLNQDGVFCDHVTSNHKFQPSDPPLLTEIGHCQHPDTFCDATDYCLDPRQSAIQPWPISQEGTAPSTFFVIAVATLVTIFIAVMLLAAVCHVRRHYY